MGLHFQSNSVPNNSVYTFDIPYDAVKSIATLIPVLSKEGLALRAATKKMSVLMIMDNKNSYQHH